jgi:hypothetical protein
MRISVGRILLAASVAAAPLRAQEPAAIAIDSYTLENGLEVILAPERGSQVVAVSVV